MARWMTAVVAVAIASSGCMSYTWTRDDPSTATTAGLAAAEIAVPAGLALIPIRIENEKVSYWIRLAIWLPSTLVLDALVGAVWHCSQPGVRCDRDDK